MPIWGRVRDSTFPEISSEAAYGDVVEVVANGGRLPLLHEGFRGSATEGRNRLRPIPSHCLVLTTRPISDPADDLEHFPAAALRFRRGDTLDAVECVRMYADGFGELALGHAEPLRHVVHHDDSLVVDETGNELGPSNEFHLGLISAGGQSLGREAARHDPGHVVPTLDFQSSGAFPVAHVSM